jgi:hypothetical protein
MLQVYRLIVKINKYGKGSNREGKVVEERLEVEMFFGV